MPTIFLSSSVCFCVFFMVVPFCFGAAYAVKSRARNKLQGEFIKKKNPDKIGDKRARGKLPQAPSFFSHPDFSASAFTVGQGISPRRELCTGAPLFADYTCRYGISPFPKESLFIFWSSVTIYILLLFILFVNRKFDFFAKNGSDLSTPRITKLPRFHPDNGIVHYKKLYFLLGFLIINLCFLI